MERFATAASRRAGLDPPLELKPGAFHDFCQRRSSPRWVEGAHLRIITAAMQRATVAAIASAGINIILQAPPRHGKTHVVGVLAPVFGMGTFKDLPIIYASYVAKLAAAKSREARNLMERIGHEEFDVRVDRTSRSVSDWKLLGHRSRMLAQGIGGPLTGEGALLGIIDDPYKNYAQANSALYRESVWDWFRTTFATRIESGGSILIQMTRWHEHDLVGQLLEEEGQVKDGGKWEVIDLPAECIDVKKDMMKRTATTGKAAALWPARWPWDRLQERKQRLGSYLYSAMFQQRPQPQGSSLFKRSRFRYWRYGKDVRDGAHTFQLGFQAVDKHGGTVTQWESVRVDQCWTLMTADTALSIKQSADYFCMGTWAITPPLRGRKRRILVAAVHEQLESPDQLPLIERTYRSCHARWVGIEDAQAGLATVQHAQRRGMPVKACKADHAKEVRALPLSAAYEAEDVFHPQASAWLADFETEICAFPHAKNDDWVDMAAYMELLLQSVPTPRVFRADMKKLAEGAAARAAKRAEREANGKNGHGPLAPAEELDSLEMATEDRRRLLRRMRPIPNPDRLSD